MTRIRDVLWLWGTKVNGLQAGYGFASRVSIASGLRTLGVERAMMCGALPTTEEEYAAVGHCRDLLWEMSFDEGFAFRRPLAPIKDLHQAHPNVTGVLLDDFSTTEIRKGATADILKRLKGELPPSLKLWAVIYSMSLDLPNLSAYLEHLDGISFWCWHGSELPNLPTFVERCNALSNGKPLNLGLYFYDFGKRRPLTAEQMENQVQAGLRLVRSGDCSGLCFLASSVMDVGLEAVTWTEQWVAANGSEEL